MVTQTPPSSTKKHTISGVWVRQDTYGHTDPTQLKKEAYYQWGLGEVGHIRSHDSVCPSAGVTKGLVVSSRKQPIKSRRSIDSTEKQSCFQTPQHACKNVHIYLQQWCCLGNRLYNIYNQILYYNDVAMVTYCIIVIPFPEGVIIYTLVSAHITQMTLQI